MPGGRTRTLLLFAGAVLLQLLVEASRVDHLTPDELEYLGLSGGGFGSFIRPPGYPAFLWALREGLGLGDAGALVAQALLVAGRAPLAAMLIEKAGIGGVWGPWAGGVLVAVSWTGLNLAGRALADAPAGLLAMLAAYLLLTGLRTGDGLRLAGASTAAAAALAMKPIGQLWFVVAFVAVLLPSSLPERRKVRFKRAMCLLALPLFAWFGLRLLNASRYRVATVSAIGAATAVRYWVPATLVLAEGHGSWSEQRFRELQASRTPYDLLEGRIDATAYRRTVRQSLDTLAAHPVAAAGALGRAAWKNLPRPFFEQELPDGIPRSRLLPAAGKAATAALYLMALAGAASLWRQQKGGVALALGGWFLAMAAATSISFDEGARLMYPAEWALVVLGVAGMDSLAHGGPRLLPAMKAPAGGGTGPGME